MKPFLSENFLLDTQFAQTLYHDFARNMPILDYHCHLPVEEIANNRNFDNLTQIWLNGDHYKWRAMRANGIAERFVRTLKEWLATQSWKNDRELLALLTQFRSEYNDRPHQGLAIPGLSPNEFANRIWLM